MADSPFPGLRRPRLRLWHVWGAATLLSWLLVALVVFLIVRGLMYVWEVAF